MNFVCPVTKGPLEFVQRGQFQSMIAGQSSLGENVEAAYISRTAKLAFVVEDDIVNFLPSEAVNIDTGDFGTEPKPRNFSVKKWYDEFGWVKNDYGIYNDTALFSYQELNVAKKYQILSHLRLIDRLGNGKYLLDAASGPLPHNEQLAYSIFFERRVCLDFSRTALLEAKAKLGTNAIYVMADICQLPFPDNTFDAVLSAYTIMHVDKADQETAVRELYRVLRPKKHLVIVTNSRPEYPAIRRGLVFMFRAWGKFSKSLSDAKPQSNLRQEDVVSAAPQPPHLYSHSASVNWWKRITAAMECSASIETHRMLSNDEMLWFFGHNPQYASKIRALETLMPHMLAPLSKWFLIDIQK